MYKYNKKFYLYLTLIILAICITLGIITEQLAKKQAKIDFPPNGILVDIDGRKVHLDCRGKGGPIVVFESGFDTSGSLSWSLVHNEIAKFTRTCAYDRAGMMWSEPRSSASPGLGKVIAEDLNKTLELAQEKPPYVLVGHSFGGIYISIFTKYFPDKVGGLVFVDTAHPDQAEIFNEYQEPLLSRLSYAVMDYFEPAWNFIGLTRIFAEYNDGRLINQSLRDEKTIDAFSPLSGLSLTQESNFYQDSLKEASSMRDFGDRPLYVLGAISNYEQLSDDELHISGLNRSQIPALIQKDLDTHKDQASWSTNSEVKVIYDAHHYLQFEQPKLVINAVEKIVENVRNKQSKNEISK